MEEQLSDFTETVNITSVSNECYYFMNFGRKGKIDCSPIEQFNGKKTEVKAMRIAEHQHIFRKHLSDMLMSLRHDEQLEMEQDENISS